MFPAIFETESALKWPASNNTNEQSNNSVKRSLSECVTDMEKSLPKKKRLSDEEEISKDIDFASYENGISTSNQHKFDMESHPKDAHSSNAENGTLPQKEHKSNENEFSEDADFICEENEMLPIKNPKLPEKKCLSDEEEISKDIDSACNENRISTSKQCKFDKESHSSNDENETSPLKEHKSNEIEFSEDADFTSDENKTLTIKKPKLLKKKHFSDEEEISKDIDSASNENKISSPKQHTFDKKLHPKDAHSSNDGKGTSPQKEHKSNENEFSEDADFTSDENKALTIKNPKSNKEKFPENIASNSEDDDPSIEDNISSEDEEELQDEEQSTAADLFAKHIEYENKFKANEFKHGSKPQPCSFPNIPDIIYVKPDGSDVNEPLSNLQDISQFGLKKNLLESLQQSPKKLSPFQIDFYNILADFRDLIFMRRTPTKGEEMQKVYTLHILNHILKSRAKIVHHNSKLSKNPDEEYRDRGFVRPTVVILAPFRHDCFQIVKHIESFLPECVMMNKKRFTTEYGPPPQKKKLKKKPQDYEETFKGNTDDDFKIGLRIQNKSVTLYSEFYSSDLIIASPLGLIRIAGDKKDKDVDYLSSIEILIIDRADILYQQNLVNLLNIVQDFNHLPKESHDCNFFRVRMYALDGNAKYFRQTVLISSVEQRFYESAIFRNYCFNYKGYLSTFTQVKTPGINKIFDTVRVCFKLFDTTNPVSEIDDRFEFFTKKVLPEFREKEFVQTLIYIPSYFDFVRLRNFSRENELSAVMVCEHSKPGKVAQARNYFFNGWRHFMLYTERAHFYNRYNIKGVQHVLFYQPPTNPRFFQDVNFYFLDSNPKRKGEQKTCTIIASKNDFIPLKNIVGLGEAKKMIDSEQKIFIRYVEEQKKIL